MIGRRRHAASLGGSLNVYARLPTTATDEPVEFACEAGPDGDPLLHARTVAADMLGQDLGIAIDPADLHRYGILIEA